MPNVGYATIAIIPSVRGISDELRRQLVGPAGDAGGDAGQAAGGSLKEKLAVGAAAAGAAAGALLVAGIGEAMEQANITSSLQAQLGTTGKVAAAQGKVAGKLYSSGVSGSFQEAADAIKLVVQAGLAPPDATNKQLQAIATKASDVANVFGQDLGGVTNSVSQLMRTGLAKNSGEAFDLITKGLQSGADKGGDFLDTINEYGTQFRKAGLDGSSAIGLLNQAIKGGARDADVAADAIKEFSIRAVDGSKTSADGFKALGLNADDMGAKFAKGGKAANGVLDLTLDKLRGIKDPVKQAQVATALFGTQAEDLGDALFAMDPSSAAKGLGQVGGAADKVGKTIRSGPSHEITVFTRALKQGFVDFIGGQVLPVVSRLAHGFNTYLLPPLRLVGSVVAAVLLPALSGLWTAGAAVVNWLRDMGTWLIPLGVLVGGLTLMLSANAIATAAVTAAFSIYRGAILAWTAIQRTAIAVQAAWNAVMALNPIGLVVIALVALGAALVVAWQRSETFRAVVMATWNGIRTGALWLWNTVLRPFFAWFGQIVTWLYNNVIKVYFALVVGYFKAVGAIAMWLWRSAISPVINFIVAAFKLWWAGVKLYFGLVMAGLRTLGGVFRWLWNNAVKPVFNGIVAAAKLWWTGVKTYFGLVKSGLTTLGGWFRWLWNNGVKPAFNGIRSTISNVYNTGIKPVFDRLKSATRTIADAFDAARAGIKRAWDKVSGIAKKPVVFVVNTVYGKLRGVWNTVAGAFGAPKLPAYTFATGGVLPGYTPGRDVHLAALSGGEAVMRPEWTRAVGPGYVHTMNAAARNGGVGAIRRMVSGGMPAFADGGIFGWLKGAASKGVDLAKTGVSWLKDGMKASAVAGLNKIVKPLIAKISGSPSMYRDMITGIPKRMIRAIVDFSGQADKKMEALGIGGGGYKTALTWARTQNGKRYQWGGNGNPSWDCLTLSSVITTPEGHKALEDIHPGDVVTAFQDGKLVSSRVLAKWNTGEKELFKVRTRNRALRATAGHRVLVAAPVKRPMADLDERVAMAEWDTEWKHVRDLTTSDYLVTYTGSRKEGGEEVPEDLAWLMGLWLADGSVHTSGGIRICVYHDIAERAMSVLRKHSPNRNVSHHPRHGVMVSDIQRARWMIRNGFCGKSHERTVPPVVMQWSEGAQTAFLNGYADGDGSYKGGEGFDAAPLITYKATSNELIEGIREMHLRRGDRVTVTRTERRNKDIFIGGKKIQNARPIHSIDVTPGKGSGQSTGAGHRPGLLRLVEQLKAENMSVQKVLSVEPDGVEETWDIEVEDSHSFVSDGLISHNCSGFMSAIESVIRGQKPHRRWSTHAFKGGAPAGWQRNARSPYMVGITHAGVGHTAGTLNGVKVESRGGDGVVVGNRARGYKSSLFTSRYGFVAKKYDQGGWLQPGVTAAANATGQPEAILTASQWRTVSAAAQGGAGRPVVVEVHTRDEALAGFIDVRVNEHDQHLVSILNAS